MPRNKFQKIISSVGAAMAGFLALIKFDKIISKDDPNATAKRINNMKRIALMIALLILILVVIILLLRSCQGGMLSHGTVDIPGNVIDPAPPAVEPKADLKFNNTNTEENLPFDVECMNGGSSESVLYRIVATYNSDFVLNYSMTIREDEEFQKLAEILKIKAELVGAESDTLMYDGLLSDMPPLEIALNADAETATEYLFRITIYLDASLGDPYYGQKLIADMSWWIEGQDNISVANHEFATVSAVTPPDIPDVPDVPDIPDTPQPPVITPDLNFIQINEGDNTAFDMKDIENGNSATKYFAFEVVHSKDIKVVIGNTITLDSVLNKILKVKVELVGKDGNVTLYEGLLKELSATHTLPKNDSNKTTVYYKVTVTADGLTEAYCNTKLVCDLSWLLEGTAEQLKVPSNSFEAYDKPYTPPQTATSIELTAKDGYDNIPFDIKNMLPGDSIAQYYCVSVTHDSTKTVRFDVAVDTAQKLSNVLRVKIEQLIPEGSDKVLYDGLMKDCASVDVSVTASSKTVTQIYYRITVYTNGAEVGNGYVGASLTADFTWQLQ